VYDSTLRTPGTDRDGLQQLEHASAEWFMIVQTASQRPIAVAR